MRTIVLLYSGPSSTAVYLSPMQADSTSVSIAPLKVGVPVWLSLLLHIPYVVLVSSLLVGQLISGIAGMLLVNALERTCVRYADPSSEK